MRSAMRLGSSVAPKWSVGTSAFRLEWVDGPGGDAEFVRRVRDLIGSQFPLIVIPTAAPIPSDPRSEVAWFVAACILVGNSPYRLVVEGHPPDIGIPFYGCTGGLVAKVVG